MPKSEPSLFVQKLFPCVHLKTIYHQLTSKNDQLDFYSQTFRQITDKVREKQPFFICSYISQGYNKQQRNDLLPS